MGISFVEPIYLVALGLLPPLWLIALKVGRYKGARRWLSLGLRTLLMVALIFSLAGAQIVLPVQHLTTVFLVDSSDSVTPAQRAQAESFIEQALQGMQSGDRAAVVVFGENALVERAPSDDQRLGRIQSVPVASRTNLAEAINLGLALFPAETQKRLVLLSDGGENQGRALEAVRIAAARKIPIEIAPLGDAPGNVEAALVSLATVSRAREGQEIDLLATIESSIAQTVRIRYMADNVVLLEKNIDVPAGTSTDSASVVVKERGFQRFSAEILPAQDTRPQNNEAGSLVEVGGPPQVLIVEGREGDARNLADALKATRVTPVVVGPSGVPTDLPGLADYEAIMLVNVPSRSLPTAIQESFRSFVRDLGRGLVMIGGDQSYGVGGYTGTPVEEALPVYMDVRNRQQRPDIAIVFVIDKSGSMGACHCNGGDQSGMPGGLPKVDIAKEAVAQASTILGKEDQIGVVAFDGGSHWALPITKLPDEETINKALAPIVANGSTNVSSGLLAAEDQLNRTNAKIKHVILLTDGWSSSGDQLEKAQRMRDAGITVSVVAAGNGSDPDLQKIAETGGGRYYNAQTMDDVPQIFLEETIQAVGTYIIEEPFTPAYAAESPILIGMQDGLPQLLGYNGTSEKEQARVILVGSDGAPVLAQWQYGLGRSVAWTSDMKGKWALNWVSWEKFPQFAAQMVDWTLPRVRSETVTIGTSAVGGEIEINIGAQDADGNPMTGLTVQGTVVGAGSEQIPVTLKEVAPGRYVGRVASPESGTYLIQVGGVNAQGKPVFVQTSGLLVPYSPEYRQGQSNLPLLTQIAQATGGGELVDPLKAFEHNLAAVQRSVPIGFALLLLALLLLPFDIAVRRLSLRWRDLAGLRDQRAARKQVAQAPTATMQGLQQAKTRAQRRISGEQPPAIADQQSDPRPGAPAEQQPVPRADAPGSHEPTRPLPRADAPAPAAPPTAQPPTSPAPADEPVDPLERLRAAKQRARRR